MSGRQRGAGLVAFATAGTSSFDEDRLVNLLGEVPHELIPFDRHAKLASAGRLFKVLVSRRPALVIMEGTGLAGGLMLLATRVLLGIPYIVSSGDAVGPYLGLHGRAAGVAGGLYERALYRYSAGFIGWTPYLVGRALTFGARRGMTAANWASNDTSPEARQHLRRDLGLSPENVVFGIVGSIQWNERRGYAYGLDLVRAVRNSSRTDVRVLIVGDGDGLNKLKQAAGDDPRVLFAGRVPRSDVGRYLAAIDVAALPQSVDGVGAFRYTTKLSEYLAACCPVVITEIPASFDLDDGWLWRLPGDSPWDQTYLRALTALMDRIDTVEIETRRSCIPRWSKQFDLSEQQRAVTEFVLAISDSASNR
jgi:glycosyltransferase involved in cell wall biosynthesis